ncbi:BLUF domain-containing protein [Sphingomicrobium marinum]|uniref:BLUF domain-containing protein n=1 Tax=Sphingomicrobium marinum TaxID=1227950 RepID=UPI00223EB110|nr:BLUF domain-containing protein [Sphingomicrobium marinum]
MLQLAFSSIMVEPMDAPTLDEVVARCRAHNMKMGITGSMIVGGRRLAGIIEGESNDVTSTFERICRDRRHRAIVLLGKRKIDVRHFPGQPLAHKQIAPSATPMSLARMVRSLREEKAHGSIYKPLRRYSSILAAA